MLITANNAKLYNDIKSIIQTSLRSALRLYGATENLHKALKEKILELNSELQQTSQLPEAQKALQKKKTELEVLSEQIQSAQQILRDTILNLNTNMLFFKNNKLDKQRQVGFFEHHQLTHVALAKNLVIIKDDIDLTVFNKCCTDQTILESQHHGISGRRIQALADGLHTTGMYLILLSLLSLVTGLIFIGLCCTILNTSLPLFISLGLGASLMMASPLFSNTSRLLERTYGNQDHIELNANETFLPHNELEASFSP